MDINVTKGEFYIKIIHINFTFFIKQYRQYKEPETWRLNKNASVNSRDTAVAEQSDMFKKGRDDWEVECVLYAK